MNRRIVSRPLSDEAVNWFNLHIVVKNSLTPKGWMRQIVRVANIHTRCGVGEGTGQTLIQIVVLPAENVCFRCAQLRPFAKHV
jgi:hypothetical protein